MASVMVSPTLVSLTFLMLAIIYPTRPADNSSHAINCPAPKYPTSTTSASAPVAIILMRVPLRTVPSFTLQKTMTPLYESYIESKISADNGASGSPSGAGSLWTIASRTSSILMPFLAEIRGASSASIPITSSISSLTRSGSALGRSILLITGNTSRLWSIAIYTFASVCASIPCAASTTSTAPSHAARLLDTS